MRELVRVSGVRGKCVCCAGACSVVCVVCVLAWGVYCVRLCVCL